MANIQSFNIPNYAQHVISNFFEENNISYILNENCWIAGGFARILFTELHELNYFNLLPDSVKSNLLKENLNKYFDKGGDIDIFTNNKENVKENLSILNNNKNYDWNCTAMFSENVYNTLNNTHIKIQIVNQFFYSNVAECFSEFDMSNCKFAIIKQDNVYKILCDDKAYESNISKKLDIIKYDNPFLANRIYKYITKYNQTINKDDVRVNNIVNEYLFKLLANDWPELPPQNHFYVDLNLMQESCVKYLHKGIGLSPKQLVIFLGLFEELYTENLNYGQYIYHRYDWATREISLQAQS